jgi:hypothetical protein
MALWAQVSRIVEYAVPLDREFDPERPGQWAHDRSPDELADLSLEHSLEHLPVFTMHSPGLPNGTGFNQTPWTVTPEQAKRRVLQWEQWRQSRGVAVYARRIGNETEVILWNPRPTPAEVLSKWFPLYAEIFEACVSSIERGSLVFSGGLLTVPQTPQRWPSLNHWLGQNLAAGKLSSLEATLRARNQTHALDVHLNSVRTADIRRRVRDLRELFGIPVGVTEDTPRAAAGERAQAAKDAGAICYAVFGRWLERRWGVREHGKVATHDLAAEGPDGINQPNLDAAIAASQVLGEFKPDVRTAELVAIRSKLFSAKRETLGTAGRLEVLDVRQWVSGSRDTARRRLAKTIREIDKELVGSGV